MNSSVPTALNSVSFLFEMTITGCKAIATFAITAFHLKSGSIGINITHSQETASAQGVST
ncbi:hypothetical protein QUA71_27005 [Microcoleus sp. MON1_C5]|uniref:hypothetical protein n=1 Tax=Microcoleus sp. MON1_C5 TaxID=2818828 RepID=UPI002FD1F5A6